MKLDEIFSSLDTSLSGLSDKEASKRQRKFGENRITSKEPRWYGILASQFKSFMVYLLASASLLSFLVGKNLHGFVIAFIIVYITIIGFFQEYKAEKALESIKNLDIENHLVFRQGKIKEIKRTELVPGDIVLLDVGTRIPADGRVIETFDILYIDEAVLTGESKPIQKKIGGEIFAGSYVSAGRAKMVIINIADSTKLGEIAKLVSQADQRSIAMEESEELSLKLTQIVLLLAIGIFMIGLSRGVGLMELLITMIALSVAGIPEGLPLAVTLTLASGVRKMAEKGAILRKMSALESLGMVDTICTDKTGTLTYGEFMAEDLYVGNELIKLSGEERLIMESRSSVLTPDSFPELDLFFTAIGQCNNA
ncbi:MAG: HAD-IC family P-type ATPase, partial [Candidatus Altiarchaeota archaeon]|nr:HAD-IC family P-type ATPase [Candidatus Altiarchaeota archaeon]